MLESLFNKVADLKTSNLIKKRLGHRHFPGNIEKFLRTTFFMNTSGGCFLLFIVNIYCLNFCMREKWDSNPGLGTQDRYMGPGIRNPLLGTKDLYMGLGTWHLPLGTFHLGPGTKGPIIETLFKKQIHGTKVRKINLFIRAQVFVLF